MNAFWSQIKDEIDEAIQRVEGDSDQAGIQRSDRDILEEVLDLTRKSARQLDKLGRLDSETPTAKLDLKEPPRLIGGTGDFDEPNQAEEVKAEEDASAALAMLSEAIDSLQS